MRNLFSRRRFVASAVAAASSFAAGRSWAQALIPAPSPAARSAAMRLRKQAGSLAGKMFTRTDEQYASALNNSIWNARKPSRYPNAVVMAETVDDVIAAVKLARANGLQIGVRSTGHSWTAPHTRDKAILINLSKMQDVSINAAARTAVVSPAVQGQILNHQLREHGLMFPTGHCHGVGLGGYILGGGLGWNSRSWGPACASLTAVDIVTAEGELIHADEHNHADYLWAARGSGPGFFGIAVRYYLNLFPLPKAMMASAYVYPVESFDGLYGWLRDAMHEFPQILEVFAIGRVWEGEPRLRVSGVAMGNSEEESRAALAILQKCPVLDTAISRSEFNHVELPSLVESPTSVDKHGFRFAVDNMWTNAPSSELIPAIREMFTKHPTPQSYALWQCWGQPRPLKDMAFSVQGDVYISCNVLYSSDSEDKASDAWAVGHLKSAEALSAGSFINDENMAARKSRYFSDEAWTKIKRLKARYDPHNVFVSYLNA